MLSLEDICQHFEFGAVQKRANLVDPEKIRQNEYLLDNKIGVDTAESDPNNQLIQNIYPLSEHTHGNGELCCD